MVALFVILTIVAFLLADAVLLWTRRRRESSAHQPVPARSIAELIPQPDLPGGVFLSPAHLWVGLMPAGLARIGFDPLVRSVLGTPDSVEVPPPGTKLAKGDALFAAKWGSRSVLFRSPVNGVVQAGCPASGALDEEGWIVTIEPSQAKADLGILPMAEEAKNWFAQEWNRLTDFVVAQSLRTSPAMVMPDGGRPVSGWMRHEPDPTWDSFVQAFLQEKTS